MAQFVASGRARVVAPGDDHFGQTGVIDPLYDEEDAYVFLKFEGEPDTLAFRRDEVVPVLSVTAAKSTSELPRSVPATVPKALPTSPPKHPKSVPSRPPNAPASPVPAVSRPAPKAIEYWRGLKRMGRIAVVAVPVVALVGIIAAVSALGSNDEGSYQADDQHHMFVEMLDKQYGIIIDSDAAVDMGRAACEAPTTGVGLYNTQRALQQRYPDNSLNTVATVMSASSARVLPRAVAVGHSGCRRRSQFDERALHLACRRGLT